MSFRELESAILMELREVSGNRKIRLKDIMEWSTGKIEPQEGETYFYLPRHGVHACVKVPVKKVKAEEVAKAAGRQ